MDIIILGSTGTIGRNTLKVIDSSESNYKIFGLTAKSSLKLLAKQICKYKPSYAVVEKKSDIQKIKSLCGDYSKKLKILHGKEGLCRLASFKKGKCLVSAISGAAALEPTYSAVKAGKKVLLANKEALIMSGDLLLREARKTKSLIIPIDSEHNALLQIISIFGLNYIHGKKSLPQNIDSISLTASGGPFLGYNNRMLSQVTPKQAIKHPNWKMGKKISIDSATMMNKGLEVIEASLLFNINPDKINVYIHPQSLIHALITFYDGSTLSHISYHDMKIPISYALNWPNRQRLSKKMNNLNGTYELRKIKKSEYPCYDLCIEALKIGKNATTIINAANEVAVEYFLQNKIKFTDIPVIIKYILKQSKIRNISNISDILKYDIETRNLTEQLIKTKWK